MHNLALSTNIQRIQNAVAAGAAPQQTSTIDMEDYDGVLIIAAFGAIVATAVTYIKVQQSSDDGVLDAYSDLEGTRSSTLASDGSEDNHLLVCDIYRPQKRYLQVTVFRGTANATIDDVVAIKYHGKVMPRALDATVAGLEYFNSPAEGTA